MKEWKEYLNYLKDWADNHNSIYFVGCSPACYDEWLDNEYEEQEEE